MEKLFNLVDKLHMTGTETLTPSELAKEMLDHLPPGFFTDPQKTFLDLTCGTGTFYLCLLQRLDEGLKEVIPDRKERLAHIMSKQLYACEIDRKQWRRFKAALRLLGLEHFAKNIYNDDSLKRVWAMKFDVGVGNPPYNLGKRSGASGAGNACWQKFVSMSWDLLVDDGYLCMVHPPEWRTNRYSRANKNSSEKLFKSSMIWVKAAFPYPGASCTVDAYVCQKNNKIIETQWVNADNTHVRLKIDAAASYLTNNQSEMITKISEKILQLPPWGNGLFSRKSMGGLVHYDMNVVGDFVSVCGATFKRIEHRHPHIHQFFKKVIMSDSRDFRAFYDTGKLGIGDHVHYILVPDEETAQWFIALTNSRISRFFQWVFCEGYNAQAGKHGGEPWNSPLPLSMIQLSNKKPGDDSEFYKHFNLTPEEIDYIEKVVK